MKTTHIAFIGAGNMTNAIIGGLVASGFPATNIHASNRSTKKLEELNNGLGVFTYAVNNEAVQKADILVLAIKPGMAQQVCSQIKAEVNKKNPLIISVIAGVTTNALHQWLGESLTIVRCMPNTPALIQLGACAVFSAEQLSAMQQHQCETLLQSIGIVHWVDSEDQLDAVTAISGSGPAYFFMILEIMQKLARELGLSELVSQELVLQTILGAAQMAKTSDYDVSELRRRVTSPGGTTEAALKAFVEKDIEDVFRYAINAAHKRSKTLAKELTS